jgi:protein subunit release factor B
MSDVFISTGKQAALAEAMRKLGIREADLVEQFTLGSGPGGQKINKTSSCVQLRHLPTGIAVKCQRARQRELNRFLARRELCDRLEEKILGEASRKRMEVEKIRRQKRRRSRRQKARMLEDKRHQAGKKANRRGVASTETD